MTQSSPMEPSDGPAAEIADYRRQAREFLLKSRQYLAEDDRHLASEKGWGAVAWMAKAAAEAQGWQYKRHEQFNLVLNNARLLTGDERLPGLRGIANDLHNNFYKRPAVAERRRHCCGLGPRRNPPRHSRTPLPNQHHLGVSHDQQRRTPRRNRRHHRGY